MDSVCTVKGPQNADSQLVANISSINSHVNSLINTLNSQGMVPPIIIAFFPAFGFSCLDAIAAYMVNVVGMTIFQVMVCRNVSLSLALLLTVLNIRLLLQRYYSLICSIGRHLMHLLDHLDPERYYGQEG
jgi:hypothetical protein